MNGPELFTEAQRLRDLANEKVHGGDPWVPPPDTEPTEFRWTHRERMALLADAQVCATLALVAATRGPADAAWVERLA